MKKFRVFFVILMLSFASNGVKAQSLTNKQLEVIESAIQDEMKVLRIPGVSVAIINNNKVIYEKWYGIANTLTKSSLTDSTIFQVASITKTFTSLAILIELKKAGIEVEAPIGNIIKGLSPGLSQITYHQLLTHTSGMIDYWPTVNEYKMDVYTFFKNVGDSILFAKPGIFNYSNTGYALLGLALEKLTNKPYTVAINDIIIKPLKLSNTTFDFFTVACRSFSAGHSFNRTRKMMLPSIMNIGYPIVQPAGGIFSNIKDLERLVLCFINQGELDGKQIFEREIIEKMTGQYTQNFSKSGPKQSFGFGSNYVYGHGLFIFDFGNLKLIGNGGSASQMTYLVYHPEKKFALVIISNSAPDLMTESIKKILEIVLEEKEKVSVSNIETLAQKEDITGKYILHALEKKNDRWVTISEKEGKFFINVGNNQEIELKKVGDLTYNFLSPTFIYPAEIGFITDKTGKVTYMNYIWKAWQKI